MKNINSQSSNSASKARFSKLVKTFGVGLISNALAVTASHAALLVSFDVRAVQVGLTGNSQLGPASSISNGGHSVSAFAGDQVLFQLVATLSATNATLTDDGFTRTDGSFITIGTTGNPVGALRTDGLTTPGVNNVDPFKGTGADSGVAAELSGTRPGGTIDSIMDIGATSTSSFTGYFTSSSNTPTGVVGQSFVLGETLLNITGGSGTTTVGYFPRIGAAGSIANRANVIFKVDNVNFSLNGDGAGAGGGADAFAFQSAQIVVVPEPSAFGMVALGAMGLVGFRRLGFRRS